MTITFSDGQTVEAILLAQHAGVMRVAIPGNADAAEFVGVGRCWISEDGDHVHIKFAWEPQPAASRLSSPDDQDAEVWLRHGLWGRRVANTELKMGAQPLVALRLLKTWSSASSHIQ